MVPYPSTSCLFRRHSRLSVVALALLALIVAAPAPALADSLRCSRAIAKASAKYARTRWSALRRCNDSAVQTSQHGQCPDAKASDRIANAFAKYREAIDTTCGGADQHCGTGGDDENLASIGWDMGTCLNLEGGGCTNAITDCAGVITCLACLDDAAVDQSVALTFDDLFVGSTETFAVKCHRSIGKHVEKFFSTKLRTLQKCEDRVLSGKGTGPCPDQKNQAQILALTNKTTARLCSVCGGADELCGTPDDLSRVEVGFPATCPAVTVPGGPACGGSIDDLEDIVQCLECVNEFKADCLDRAAVPTLVPYPPECG